MSCLTRAIWRAPLAWGVMVGVTFAGVCARAQSDVPAAAPRIHNARPAKPAAKDNAATSLELAPWFTLDPVGAGLIRTPGTRPLDLAARQEDDNNIIVLGRHKAVDPRSDREHDFSAPGWSDYVMPHDLPIGPASSCSSGAYRTIAGQSATGMDLVGGLGGGRC